MSVTEVHVRPSDVFRWALSTHGDVGAPYLALADAYRQYAHAADGLQSYLWRHYDRRLAPLTPLLRPGARVLEVGVGYGVDLSWAALSGADMLGIDVKSPFADAAERLTGLIAEHFGASRRPTLKRINLLDLPEDAPFDVIYMKEVFHHLEPRAEIVRKIAALLRPGGHVVIMEPNAWNPAIQWRLFRIRGLNTVQTKTDPETGETFVYGNERIVTGRSITRAFARVGVQGSGDYHRILPTSMVGAAIAKPMSSLEPLFERALPWPACIHYTWCGQRVGQG